MLTDDDLRAIEAQFGPDRPGACGVRGCNCCGEDRDKKALLAEVRRLRGLIQQTEWDDVSGFVGAHAGIEGYPWPKRCPWCHGSERKGHLSTCPAFPPTT